MSVKHVAPRLVDVFVNGTWFDDDIDKMYIYGEGGSCDAWKEKQQSSVAAANMRLDEIEMGKEI